MSKIRNILSVGVATLTSFSIFIFLITVMAAAIIKACPEFKVSKDKRFFNFADSHLAKN